MNEIFKSLNVQYNSSQKNQFLSDFKVCEFKNGEIVSKEVLQAGIGVEEYATLVDQKVISE